MFEDLGSILGTTVLVTGVAASLGTVIINGVKTIPARGIAFTKQRYGYSITFDSDNFNAYHNINKWILSLNKRVLNNHINLKVAYERGTECQYKTLDYGLFTIHYRKCIITINKTKNTKAGENNSYIQDTIAINLFGVNSKIIKNEIINYAYKEDIDIETDKLNVYLAGDGYGIDKLLINKKNFDSIYTPHKKEIIEFLDKWKDNKEIYDKKGITYKTGILLHGEPGTGKTTIAKAIASYLGFNLYIVTKTANVNNLLTNLKPNSVILLEDIDCNDDSNKRKTDKDSSKDIPLIKIPSSLGNLLNAIDGIASPNNTIFIATTNHKEELDEALIRTGRFNLTLNVTHLSKDEALDMCSSFGFGEEVLEDEVFPIKPSDLETKLLRLI